MSERYTRLFFLSENLYAEGSPVLISAGALLKDNQTGKVLVQLKIKNIGASFIKAAKVIIQPLDTVGAKLGEEVGYTYLDLNVPRDEEFGQKTLIPLPDKESRGFAVRLTEAVFADNTVWKDSGNAWESLPKPESIDAIGDYELVKQYRIRYGTDSTTNPEKIKDLWYCVCGALNRKDDNCHKCGKSFAELNAIDMDVLKAERDERLAKEKAESEERRITAEKAAKKAAQRRKKMFAIGTPIVVACMAFVIVLTTVIIPKQKLSKALSLLDSGDYDSAYVLLEKIGNIEAIKSNKYERAVNLIDSGDYESAYILLNGLMYKDSEEKLQNVLLKKASVGDIVSFGVYEQDNDINNNKETIEWRVLARKENRILVISEKVLDWQWYNDSEINVTWETCSLRKWLNGTFLCEAFSKEEQMRIINSTVPADGDLYNVSDSGNETVDKVFLLSSLEAEKYFDSKSARECQPTEYAVAKGRDERCDVVEKNGNCDWHLRAPSETIYTVLSDGSIFCMYFNGEDPSYIPSGIRPAMWIDLDS